MISSGSSKICRKAVEQKYLKLWGNDEDNGKDNGVARSQESNRLRSEGNKLFTARKEKRNLLAACRLYTEAICVCAREHGYPEHLMDKILLRQADCAQKLGDVELLKLHLDELNALPLNEAFMIKSSELHASLEELLERNEENSSNVEVDMSLNRESQKIVKSSGSNDRYMIATQTIKEGELIFRERPFCFVPDQKKRACHECAATQLIPFPCMRCRKVVYCSLKCRSAHAVIHGFECEAFQRNILTKLTIENLIAFRMVLTGLPQVVPLLRHLGSAKALWTKLVTGGSSIAQTEEVAYAQSLRVAPNLECAGLTVDTTMSFSLSMYLNKCTQFFNFVKTTAASQSDWQIIAGALILRHLCQKRGFERFASITLNVRCPSNFALFEDDLWARPFRVQRGKLHKLSNTNTHFLANVPYMSLANHSCVPSLQSKFSGRYVSAFATKNIEPGEEISKCYAFHHKATLFSERTKYLKENCNTICKCVKCQRPNPDEDFADFHRYRCERLECRAIFIQLPEVSTNPWHNPSNGISTEILKCTTCGKVQACMWYKEFLFKIMHCYEPSARSWLFRNFDGLNNWVLDFNRVKLFFANQMIGNCLASHIAGFSLTDAEFGILAGIAKFLLIGMSYNRVYNPIYYVSKLTYLWDMIALGKYKCSHDEMQDMLKDIEMIADEFKVIFMNYYEDYVKPLLSL